MLAWVKKIPFPTFPVRPQPTCPQHEPPDQQRLRPSGDARLRDVPAPIPDPPLTPLPPPSLLLALFDPSAQVGDTLRTVIFGAVGIMVAFSALTVLYTQLVLPGQVENAVEMLKENDPERWAEIEAKLGEGETILERGDLLEELVDISMDRIATEGNAEMARMLEKMKSQLEAGTFDMGEYEIEFEEAMDLTVEQYVTGMENFESNDKLKDNAMAKRFVTDADREFVLLLRKEMDRAKQS